MDHFKIGDEAPDFELPGEGGRSVRLSAHRGDIVVVYFYPKDDTTACTTEASDFTRLKAEFDALGAVVIGISPDGAKSHDRFRRKHSLGVELLSDEHRQAIDRYGVWVEKMLYGRTYMGVERCTLLLDRDGRIAGIWRRVRVKGHAQEVLEAARKLG